MNENNWYGSLTIENSKQIGNMIFNKLQGKKYCFVSQNYGFGEQGATMVRTNQYLDENNSLNFFFDEKENRFSGFHFNDTYGVWGCSTSKHDKDLKHGWDSSYNAPYLVLDYNQIKILQLNGDGDIICWIIAIQED